MRLKYFLLALLLLSGRAWASPSAIPASTLIKMCDEIESRFVQNANSTATLGKSDKIPPDARGKVFSEICRRKIQSEPEARTLETLTENMAGSCADKVEGIWNVDIKNVNDEGYGMHPGYVEANNKKVAGLAKCQEAQQWAQGLIAGAVVTASSDLCQNLSQGKINPTPAALPEEHVER